MQQNPAIVIIAYNRLHCLQRLMDSVLAAHYPSEVRVPLIISIDKCESDEVQQYAEGVEWTHGDKRVITHTEHLGLKEHVLRCGDLTAEYDSIIMLEDDLLVSPWFYDYALQAGRFYNDDPAVAGISLYNYQIAENRFFPFHPLHDGSDVYFIQVASSWGQLFHKDRWAAFRKWLLTNDTDVYNTIVPQYQKEWGTKSWKKRFNRYLIESGTYFVFPRISLTTNFGEQGANTDRKGLYQVPLLEGQKNFEFRKLQASSSVYDAWFELNVDILKSFVPALASFDFCNDLHGTKIIEEVTERHLLSCKSCETPIFSFGNELFSPEENVLTGCAGSFFSLGIASSFKKAASLPIDKFFRNITPIWRYIYDQEISIIKSDISNAEFQRLNTKLRQEYVEETEAFVRDMLALQEENRKYPKAFVGVISHTETKFNFEAPQYKESQLQYSIWERGVNAQDVVTSIQKSNAEYYVVLNENERLLPNALETVNAIFQRYPDINWLTGIQTITTPSGFQVNNQTTPSRRWNEHIFQRSIYGLTGRYIPSGATFFKRHLWDLAKDELNITSMQTFCEDLWAAFFKYQKLYTVDAYLSTAIIDKENLVRYNKKSDLLEINPVNRILEWFFLRNIPVLRAYYKEHNELAHVVRFDFKTQSHWLSEY